MKMLTEADFNGKTVLVRVDFNVPLDKSGHITDDRRITAALPTINHILNSGGSVVLMSHLGRPKGEKNLKYSLLPVKEHLGKLLNKEILFCPDCIGPETELVCQNLQPGSVVLLENLRFYFQEEKGESDFADRLARLGTVYVNDAFGTAHRAHASVSEVPKRFTEKYAGFLMKAEIDNADKVLKNAERPFTAIMGGAKVSDKIGLIKNLLPLIDNLIIGGGMTYTFALAMGYEIGTSIRDTDHLEMVKALPEELKKHNVNLILPIDTVVAEKALEAGATLTVPLNEMPPDKAGVDIGPESVKNIEKILLESKTILWNGPMGVCEVPEYAHGTRSVAEAVVKATQHNGAFSLVGGGDSAAAVEQLGFSDKVSYVSTGGGALLEYLQGDVLPGIEALE